MQIANRKLAIIDIGSNTIRLVIYRKNKFGKYKEEENIKCVARLRHYLVDNGNLHDQGISILVNCLKGFKEIIEFHKVEEVKCVATATIRQAVNKEDVLDIVNEQNEKLIRKAFKRNNLDLSQDEIHTYKTFGYIEPISKEIDNLRGYKISEVFKDDEKLDYKVKSGKIWDLNGKCMNRDEKDEIQIFRDNLKIWIDFPHVLDNELRKSYEAL